MSDPRSSLGKRGENFVADRLRHAGYTILARNWRHSKFGEIDIVAQHADQIVFVEVRTRRGPAQIAVDAALSSVGTRKQVQLVRLAQAFLAAHNMHEAAWRIDVAAVGFQNGAFSLEIVRDAVEW
jgi:putative endonuclease